VTLAAGTRLGPYEIVAPLGAGGMGEVWRARDPRLGREVAVKVLPAQVAADPERLRRFESEARAAAALSHPNVLAVHDVGSDAGVTYLVYELLQGDTVRARLAGGAVGTRRALEWGTQIARGLAAAHGAGIVHRDLKPENLFVTARGDVKILDFGLAKLAEGERETPLSSAPTVAAQQTGPGVVLGTVGYMAPEQVRGESADQRSDLFALGVVLHELLTGEAPFARPTAVETMSAILREEPPDAAVADGVPPLVAAVVRRCLEKRPEARFQSASDLAFQLEALADLPGSAAPDAVRGLRGRRWRGRPLALGLALAAAASAGALAAWLLRPPPPPHRAGAVRFELEPPAGRRLAFDVESHDLALSPDGTRLAFVADPGRTVFVRALAELETRELAGTGGATSPFWSPDGAWLAFFSGGKLRKIPAAGGAAQTVCEVQGATTGAWGDGVILFTQTFHAERGLYRVSAAGGRPAVVDSAKLGTPRAAHRWPVFLPGGRRFLVFAWDREAATHRVFAGELGVEGLRPAFDVDRQVAIGGPATLVHARDGALVAQRYDPRSLAVAGEPRVLATEVRHFPNGWTALAASPAGVVAYSPLAEHERLVWRDLAGRELGTFGEPGAYGALRISPDGERVAYELYDLRTAESDLWVGDLGRGVAARLTSEQGFESNPVWSPDGGEIAYNPHGSRASRPELVAVKAGGGTPRVVIDDVPLFVWVSDWTAGGTLVLSTTTAVGTHDLQLVSATGKVPPAGRRPVWRQTAFNEVDAVVSRDGRWIAYGSDESERFEVYLESFPTPGRRWRVSDAGGNHPRFHPTRPELYYAALDGAVVRVELASWENPTPALPRRLFDAAGAFDLHPDGERLLVAESIGERELRVTVLVGAVDAEGAP
jgi:Tol biopolymer transport system component